MRTGKAVVASALIVAMLMLEGVLSAQGPQGQIEEVVALDNDSVRVALLPFPRAPPQAGISTLPRRWESCLRGS